MPTSNHIATSDIAVAAIPGPHRQASVARAVTRAGKGLHTGRVGRVTIRPAPADHGIVFSRDGQIVPAVWSRRVSQPLCTSLRFPDGTLARTVEHLMAALAADGIDNALVELSGEELPIFNGSATPWCEALDEAGRADLGARRQAIKVLDVVEHRRGVKVVRVEPSDRFSLQVSIALKHFGPLTWRGTVTADTFRGEIAPSRSFGRLQWALPAKIYGLVKRDPPLLRGANFGSTAVLWRGTVLGGMTVPDEPVRHRALDVIGDLALAGAPILGHVTAEHPGHEVNQAFLAALMRDTKAWTLVDL